MIVGHSFKLGFMLLYTADPGASDDQIESLSTDSQSATYPVTSTDSDPTELSSLKMSQSSLSFDFLLF